MKKLGVVLASALAAGLFFGCSNDSDDNNMGLLLAVANGGGSSITANLPENVGANELAGKSFQYEFDFGNHSNHTISFDNNTVTFTNTTNFPEENGTKAYTFTAISTKRYSYNAETKNLYHNGSSFIVDKTIYTNDANEKFESSSYWTFSTEKEYSAIIEDRYKNLSKIQGKEFTDEELNDYINGTLKNFRKQVADLSSQYNLPTAYTDKNYETPLTPAQISFYNKFITFAIKADEKIIKCFAYELDGDNLKLYNSGNLPAGIKFGGIYNGTYNFSADIKNNGLPAGTININALQIIDPDNSLGAKNFTPSITVGGLSLKVTSASDDSVTCILQLPDSTSKKITLKLENKTTAEKTTVTVKMPQFNLKGEFVDYEERGTFEIPYNKALPDYYTTYTKCE